jgi:methionyl-tRNA formyltransferase
MPGPEPAVSHRVLFMGTPAFAVPTLERLLATQAVVGVATQPDRPAGRGRRLRPSPVKELARAHGVPVYQPQSLRRAPEAVAELAALRPDVVVVAAYGLILPPAVLALAPGGALNVHASLLPRWRGAAPVAYAILAGDEETGVTIMQMDEGLDTGPMLARRAVPVGPEETAGELGARLAVLGAELLAQTLGPWLAGRLVAEPQPGAGASYAPRLGPADARLDWREPAAAIARRVRAMSPAPGAFGELPDGTRLKVLAARVVPGLTGVPAPAGTLYPTPDGPAVGTGEGGLLLVEVQPAGGRPMRGADLLRGRPGLLGARLLDPEVDAAPQPA